MELGIGDATLIKVGSLGQCVCLPSVCCILAAAAARAAAANPSARPRRCRRALPAAPRQQALAQATGARDATIKAAYDESGDLGLVAVSSRGKQKTLFVPKPLTLRGVSEAHARAEAQAASAALCCSACRAVPPTLLPGWRRASPVDARSPMPPLPLLLTLGPLLLSSLPTGLQGLPRHCGHERREERRAQEEPDPGPAGVGQGAGGGLRDARAAGAVWRGRVLDGAVLASSPAGASPCLLPPLPASHPPTPAPPPQTGQAAHRAGGADGAAGAGARDGAGEGRGRARQQRGGGGPPRARHADGQAGEGLARDPAAACPCRHRLPACQHNPPSSVSVSFSVLQVYSECPSFDELIPALLTHPLEELPTHVHFKPGVPIKPMLAKPTTGAWLWLSGGCLACCLACLRAPIGAQVRAAAPDAASEAGPSESAGVSEFTDAESSCPPNQPTNLTPLPPHHLPSGVSEALDKFTDAEFTSELNH